MTFWSAAFSRDPLVPYQGLAAGTWIERKPLGRPQGPERVKDDPGHASRLTPPTFAGLSRALS